MKSKNVIWLQRQRFFSQHGFYGCLHYQLTQGALEMALQKSDWKHEDNKHYRGHLDRIYVSTTEEWEVGYFVDKYLKDHNSTTSDKNRDVIMQNIAAYPGKKPILRTELTKFLDGKITFTAAK